MAVVSQVLPTYQEAQILTGISTTAVPAPEGSYSVVSPVGTNLVTLTAVQLPKSDPDLDGQKNAIYRHPLFPLMALLFEKCELASQTPDCPSSESFDVDIQAFVVHQEKDKKPFFSDDPELDGLMVKAIQVLRIHLLELEKVTELCKDFCNRYTTCLKGKLQSENLLRTESDLESSMFDPPPPENPNQPNQTPQVVMQNSNSNVLVSGFTQPAASMATLGPGQIVSGGTVYQMVQTPQGLVAQPIQIQTTPIPVATQMGSNGPIIHGSTPLSQIGVPNTKVNTQSTSSGLDLSGGPGTESDDDDVLGKKKSKRGVLPKRATQIMKTWLFQHIVHPYPTEDEKRQIASQTDLTLLQVNNWFINARRRILQPMLDASNPEQVKAKKSKPPSRPPQRFWPFADAAANNKDTPSKDPASVATAPTVLSTPTYITSDMHFVNVDSKQELHLIKTGSPVPSEGIAEHDTRDSDGEMGMG